MTVNDPSGIPRESCDHLATPMDGADEEPARVTQCTHVTHCGGVQ